MNNHFLNDAYQYIEVSYAPSGRATCKGCKVNIPADYLRIGEIMQDDHFNSKKWHHWECYKLKPRFRNIDAETQLYNIQNLDKKDAKRVINHIKDQVSRITGNPRSAKKQNGKGKSRNKSQPKEEKKVSQPKKGGKSKSKPKSQEKKVAKKIEQQAPRIATRLTRSTAPVKSVEKPAIKEEKPNKRLGKSTSGADIKLAKAEPSPKKVKKKVKKLPKTSGYTAKQFAEYKEYFNQLMEMSADQLKKILAANNQSRTGVKTELADKCADGKVLGKIPICSNCGGGKPRFNRNLGIYTCPGYMDDDVFRNCHKKSTMEEIKREEWIEP